MNQLLHLCGHPYHQDCMNHPPTVEQVQASVCPMCAIHVLYSVVGEANEQDTATRFDAVYLTPRSRTLWRMGLAARSQDEASEKFQARYPFAVYLAPDALDTVVAGRQPKERVK